MIYVVAESKQSLRATAVKSDRPDESPAMSFTNPETGFLVLPLEAAQGSYLIELTPESDEKYAALTVRFLNAEEYAAQAENLKAEAEQDKNEEAGQAEHEESEPEFTLPENRSVHIEMTMDTENPQIGDMIHFNSVITGYENIPYTLQWQTSRDGTEWTDYAGATEPRLDITLTEETSGLYFRLIIHAENEQQAL